MVVPQTNAKKKKVDDSDDEVEIIVDVPRELRRVPKTKPRRRAASPIHHVHFHTHYCLRIYILHAPAPAVLASHLAKRQLARRPPADDPASTRTYGDYYTPARTQPPQCVAWSPDPGAGGSVEVRHMPQHAIRQGFFYEEAAAGAHGLLSHTLLAVAEPTPATDSDVCAATTTTSPDPAETDPGMQNASLDLNLDLVVSMNLGDGPADADTGGLDDIVDPPPLTRPSLTRCCVPRAPMTTQMGPYSAFRYPSTTPPVRTSATISRAQTVAVTWIWASTSLL